MRSGYDDYLDADRVIGASGPSVQGREGYPVLFGGQCHKRVIDGAAQGAEAVRTILVAIRTLYESQEFNFVGPVGDNGLLEDYTAQVRGKPVSCVVLVTRDAAGQTQHIVANYRPDGAVKTGDFQLAEPTEAELARRRNLT